MATVEFLQKRIDGKLAEIEKLDKKIARIEQAKASNWEKNPYYYNERDLVYAMKEKADAEAGLQKYRDQLEEENNKAASRNIPAITEFLDRWEIRVVEYFLDQKDKYDEARVRFREEDKELSHKLNYELKYNTPEYKEVQNQIRENYKKFREAWTHVTQFNHGSDTWEKTMRRDIAIEKARKYDDLIDRVVSVVGAIIDTKELRVGAKGDLNGVIDGDKGSVEVRTIGAGGYNIQCYHYRTLVKKIK